MSFSGITEADAQLATLLDGIDAGDPPGELELKHAEAKEEPGRRDAHGQVLPHPADPEEVADLLFTELACMANTPGGGAIVLGVGDDGARPGTTVDPEWLRHRIFELSQRRITPDIRRHELADGAEVLICRVLQAVEAVRVNGRINWRVDDHCVEVDPANWAAKLGLLGSDWSAERSDRSLEDADPAAVNELRRLLHESGDPSSAELARLQEVNLLRRIPNLVLPGDQLSNAGRLLLTDVPVAIDYVHRPSAGADSTIRIEQTGPLLVQLRAVTDAMGARARTVHVETPGGLTIGRFSTLPQRAAREAVMNGLLHRDWKSPTPTLVEHVGDTLRVVSPGGLIGSVTPENIIKHPSTPRHRALTEAASRIRLVEREGIGVDRMYADLIALGRPGPVIREAGGPTVEVTLIGGDPDPAWIGLRQELPHDMAEDLNIMMALDHITRAGWASEATLAPVIQDHEAIARDALDRLNVARVQNRTVIRPVAGRPEGLPATYRLSDHARKLLGLRAGRTLTPESRADLALAYAREGGRISSTEAADLLGISQAPAGEVLKQLATDGHLEPSSPTGGGRGFHYLPA